MAYEVNGIDVSRYQAQDPSVYDYPKKINWQQALDSGIKFAIIRCGLGYIEDWTYEYNRSECERLGIPFGIYHAFWPTVADQDKQIQFCIDRIAGNIYPALDMERDVDLVPIELSKRARYYAEGVASVRKPMIYTRASWWDYYIKQTWGGVYPLWIAHYGAKTPSIPMGWYFWKFWQHSADGNGEGAKYGMQSNSVDLNRYYGNLTEFGAEFDVIVPPQPVPCDTKCVVLVDGLRVRKGPGTNYAMADGVNILNKGDIVVIQDIAGSNVWVKLGEERFSAYKINTTKYMDFIVE